MNTLPEWLNRNAHRAFPFEENSDFSCTNGNVLPNSVVLDMRVCLLGTEDSDVLLKSATIADDGSVSLVLSIFGEDVSVSSDGLSGYRVSLRVILGAKEELAPLAGSYVLRTPARLLRGRIVSIPYGIGVDTLTCGTKTAYGEIRVADGHNTELDIDGRALRLRVVKGGGKGVICQEHPNTLCDGHILYYLNGQKADSDGSIWIKGGDGVAVSAGKYKGIPAILVTANAKIGGFMYR